MGDINDLNFTMIKRKLQEKEEGQGWTKAQCDAAQAEYKRFLALKRIYPDKEIVPHKAVDIFWHQHIFDTLLIKFGQIQQPKPVHEKE